jgi:hypothetical protein
METIKQIIFILKLAMRKLFFFFYLFSCCAPFMGCNSVTPEKYFDIAVLNCNGLHGFAGTGIQRELESPSVKMIDGDKDKIAPMKRTEVIDEKIQFIEENKEKLKQLNETDDTRNMLQASTALYDYVLPVYKNEYRQLAALYDENAPREKIDLLAKSISDKHYPKFVKLFDKLTDAGKSFAAKHHINVQWDVQTSPR